MAYCVHCGVKLGESEKRCPLCATIVLDPAQPPDPFAPRPYPERTPEQKLKHNKKFFLLLSALILLAPALICLMTDLLLGSGVTWSIYPSGVLVLLFIGVIAPLLATKWRTYISLTCNFCTLSAYLFLVERITQGEWFFPYVFPSLGISLMILLVPIILFRLGKLNKLTLLASCIAGIAAGCLSIEWICDVAANGKTFFSWSPFVSAPCIFVSLALFFINGNRSIREEVRRRVHF